MDWAKDQYQKQYNIWVPWLEDLYLRYFTRDNKASYIARGMCLANLHQYFSALSPWTLSITHPCDF